jgi:hypothetical protein
VFSETMLISADACRRALALPDLTDAAHGRGSRPDFGRWCELLERIAAEAGFAGVGREGF